ncbi:MAG: dihydrodipicolinate synthase family protein [Oscillospiraceae bacterium]|nr:dihydrodipicolinate synthase family protein [Oscillospiraceae bacterium]
MLKDIPGGIYPTMITPYTTDNKVDYNAVEQLLAWYAERNVNGIFAICQSSEIFFLSFEERLELLKFIMAHKPANTAIVASGNVANDLDRQIYEAKAFTDTGIDAYVFISNRFASPDDSDDVLLKNMEYAADALSEISLGVYECPYPYKRLLTPYVLKKMAETGRYRFLKDTCCDLSQLKEKLDAVKGSDLKIFNANSATLLESLKLGCAGFSGVMANFHPEIYAKLYGIYKTETEKAELLQNFIGFFSVAECQCYPVNAKYYLSLEGLKINIDSRSKSKAEFTPSRMAEIRQMRILTQLFEKNYL